MHKKIIAVLLIIAVCLGTTGMKCAVDAPQEYKAAAMDYEKGAALHEYEDMKEFQKEVLKLRKNCQNVVIITEEPDLSALTAAPINYLFCRDIFVLVFADGEEAKTAAAQIPGAVINTKQTINDIFCDNGTVFTEGNRDAGQTEEKEKQTSSLKLAVISNDTNAAVMEDAIRFSMENGTEIDFVTLNIYDENGESTVLDACIAVEAAIEEKADIILLPSGGEGSSALMEKAVSDAYEAGIPVVTAAGDHSEDIKELVPANVKQAITVSATDEEKNLSEYSNYGNGTDFTSYGFYNRKWMEKGEEKTAGYSGTSIAAAHVCAWIASAMISAPEMTVAELEEKMIAEAEYLEDDIVTPDEYEGKMSLRYGHGFLYKEKETAYKERESESTDEKVSEKSAGKTEEGTEELFIYKNQKAAVQERAASVHVSTFSEFKKYAEDTTKDYTIYLDRTINLTEQMDITKKITIYLNGYTIRPKDKNFPVTDAGAARVAFYVKKGAVLSLKGSGNISGNSSVLSMQGNLIYVKSGGTFEADNVTFLNVKNIQSVTGDGTTSLLYNDGTTVFNGCTIKNCVSDYGYTIFCRAGTMDISKCTIQRNTGGAVAGSGGKIYIHNNTLIQENATAAKYKEKNYKGASNGGIVAQRKCAMYLYGTVTLHKNSSFVSGGGLHNMGTVFMGYKPDGTAVSSKITFSGNKSEKYGGGIGVLGGTVSLSNQAKVEIKENQCANGYTGSGIYIDASDQTEGRLTAENGAALTVHENGTAGSGICVKKDCVLSLATDNVKVYKEAVNGIVSSGSVSLNGGSFYQNKSNGLYSSGSLTINGGSFCQNKSNGVYSSGSLTVNGGKFYGNGSFGLENAGVADRLSSICVGMSEWNSSNSTYTASMNVEGGFKNSGTVTNMDQAVILAMYSGIVNSGKISNARTLKVMTSTQDRTGKKASVRNYGIMTVNRLSIIGHGYHALANSGTFTGSVTIDGRYRYTDTGTVLEKESTRNFLTGVTNSGTMSLTDSFLTNCADSAAGNVIYNSASITLCNTGVYNGARNGISNYGEVTLKDGSVISGNLQNGIYSGIPGDGSAFQTSTTTINNAKICGNERYGISSEGILNIGTASVYDNGMDGIRAFGKSLNVSGTVSVYGNTGNGLSNRSTASLNGSVYVFGNGGCGLWNSTDGMIKINSPLISGFRKYKNVSDYELAANGTYAVKNEGIMDFAGKSNAINYTRLYGNNKNYAVFGNMGAGSLTIDEHTNLALLANGSKWGLYNDTKASVAKINGNKTTADSSIDISGTAVVGMENFGTADLHNISINGMYHMGTTARTVSDKNEIGILLRQSGGKLEIDGEKTKLSHAQEDGIYVKKNCNLSLLGGNVFDNGKAGIHNEGNVQLSGGTISANEHGIYNRGTVTMPLKSTVKVEANLTGIYNSPDGTLIQKDGKIAKNTSKTGIAQHGIYKISGNAVVDADNYVYLAKGCCITVEDVLNTKGLTARIRPEDYFLGRVVVKAEAAKGKELNASELQNWDQDRGNHLRFTIYTPGKDEEFTQKVYSALGLGDKINSAVFASDAGLNGTKTICSSKDGTSLYDKILSQKFSGKNELTADAESWKNDIFLTETYSITFDDHIYMSYDSSRDSEKEEYQVKAWKRYTDSEVNNAEVKASLADIMKNADLFRVNVNNSNPLIKYWCEDLSMNDATDEKAALKDASLKTEPEEVYGVFAYWFFDKKEYPTETVRQAEYSDEIPNIITEDEIVKADNIYTLNESHVFRSAWDLSYDVDYSYQGMDSEKKELYSVKMALDLQKPFLSDYSFPEYVEMEDCESPDAQNSISDGSIIYTDASEELHKVTDYVSSVENGEICSALQKAEEAGGDDSVRHLLDESNETVRKFHLSEQPVSVDRNIETDKQHFSVLLAWTQDPYAEFDHKNMFGKDSLKLNFLFPMYLQQGIENPEALIFQQKVYHNLHPAA